MFMFLTFINPGTTTGVLFDPRASLNACCTEGMRVRDLIFFIRNYWPPLPENVIFQKIKPLGGSTEQILTRSTIGVENDPRQTKCNISASRQHINEISKFTPMFLESTYRMGLLLKAVRPNRMWKIQDGGH
jgi:hypothetical protein